MHALRDPKHEHVKLTRVSVTPEVAHFDQTRRLADHGRIDDNWQEPSRVTRRELAAALDALLAGRAPAPEQLHAIA